MRTIKKAIITGTSRGLGLYIAKKLLEEGWIVYGISRSKNSLLISKNYYHFKCDIAELKELKSFFYNIRNIRFNLLINNASIFFSSKFEKSKDEEIDSLINTNIKGQIFTTKYSLPLLKKNSQVIFINSVAGLSRIANQSIYCSSKHAIAAFAGVIAEELREKKVRVTSIHPGGINTSLWNKSNPYKGGKVEDLLQTKDIFELVKFIVSQPENIVISSVKLFPAIEFH